MESKIIKCSIINDVFFFKLINYYGIYVIKIVIFLMFINIILGKMFSMGLIF